MPPRSTICFGAFELDLDTAEIRKHGRKLRLAPQPFQVLALLAHKSGELVTRETLRSQLWDSDTFVDSEHGLNFCIRQIRSTLGESARRPRFIETLPRRGYRFNAQPATRERLQNGGAMAGARAGALQGASAELSKPHATTVVVLEFENLSGDDASDWLATGLAETLATDLRRLRSVRIASRDRTRALVRQIAGATAADSRAGYVDLGRQLAADWIVAGSYQHAGGRLRITPQLLEVASGEIEAIPKIDGTWDEIFELQDRVASRVMEGLKLSSATEVSERTVAPETRLLEAYEHYSRGRRGLYQMGKGTLEDARQHFESALSLDAKYAMAHSGLGSTLAMRFIGKTNPNDLRLARAHLERARELDPELPEPYPWLCYVYIREGRFTEALEAGQRGVQLLPDLVHAQYFMSAAYTASCESYPTYYQRAVNHLREAARIDPRWQATWYVLGAVALFHGNYPRAEEFSNRLLLLNSSESPLRFIGAEMLLGTAELRRGNTPGAIRWFTESLAVHGRSAHVYRDLVCAFSSCGLGDTHLRHGGADVALTHYRRAWQGVQEAPTMLAQERAGTRALAGMAAAYAAQGEFERARELLAQSLQWLANARLPVHVTPLAWLAELLYAIAATQVRIGQHTEALDMLGQALSAGWRDVSWPERDPEMRPLHPEPRFTRFLEELRRCPTVDITVPDVAAPPSQLG